MAALPVRLGCQNEDLPAFNVELTLNQFCPNQMNGLNVKFVVLWGCAYPTHKYCDSDMAGVALHIRGCMLGVT